RAAHPLRSDDARGLRERRRGRGLRSGVPDATLRPPRGPGRFALGRIGPALGAPAVTLYAGIEAGGTKFVCVVGAGPDDIRAEVRLPTTSPEATLQRTLAFFREQRAAHGPLTAAGIASFGPVDLDPASPTHGFITTTPKA